MKLSERLCWGEPCGANAVSEIEELERKAALFDKMAAFPQHVNISTHAPFGRKGVAWHIDNDCHSFSINADTLEEALNQIPEVKA